MYIVVAKRPTERAYGQATQFLRHSGCLPPVSSPRGIAWMLGITAGQRLGAWSIKLNRRKDTSRPAPRERASRPFVIAPRPGSSMRKSPILSAAAVAVVALLVRALVLISLADSPLLTVLMGDARAYDEWARRIAAGDWLGSEVFYQAPLYPYFLGTLYSAFGPSTLVVRCVQVVLGAACCGLLVLVGRRLFDLRTGILAGLLLAFYPPAIFFDIILQKTSLGLFLLTLAVFCLARDGGRRSARWAAGAGATLGLLVLTRENAVVLLPVLVVILLIAPRLARLRNSDADMALSEKENSEPPAADSARHGWRPLAASAVLTAAFLAVLLPVAARNSAVGGVALPTASNMGVNFYIGNHAGASGLYQPLRGFGGNAGHELDDATDLANAASGRDLSAAEVSRYWLSQGLAFAKTAPAAWMGLLARKWALVWNAAEIPDTEALEAYAADSPLLAAVTPLWHFGVLAPLAVFGTWATRRRWPDLMPFYGILLALSASIALFFVFARFRHPMVALLILLAAAGLALLPELLRARRWNELLAGAALAIAAALAVNWPILPSGFLPEAITRTNLGNALLAEDRLEDARQQLQRSLALQNGSFEARYGLALVLAKQGDTDAALDHFLAVLEAYPNHADAHYFVGLIRRREGDFDAARRHFDAAVTLRPDHADARNNLAAIYIREGRLDDALREYELAVSSKPDHADSHFNLAGLFHRRGETERVRFHLQELLRLRPDDSQAKTLLAQLEPRSQP